VPVLVLNRVPVVPELDFFLVVYEVPDVLEPVLTRVAVLVRVLVFVTTPEPYDPLRLDLVRTLVMTSRCTVLFAFATA
jgi:hypothetical protein